jgi:hypothetical protein
MNTITLDLRGADWETEVWRRAATPATMYRSCRMGIRGPGPHSRGCFALEAVLHGRLTKARETSRRGAPAVVEDCYLPT